MKSCPSCHQSYPDDGPEYCTNDGTPLTGAGPSYSPGAPWQASAGQEPLPGWQQPPPGWQQPPPGWGYPPPGQYPPYGYPPTGGAGLSKAALLTGVGALGSFILAIVLVVIGANSGVSTLRDMLPIVVILVLLAMLAGLTAVILGIVTLSMSSRNPAINKVHGILGICFGAVPLILWLFGLANTRRW